MLASAPCIGCLPFQSFFGCYVLLLGRFAPSGILGAFAMFLVVDQRPSVIKVSLVVVLVVGLIVVLPWCALLSPFYW